MFCRADEVEEKELFPGVRGRYLGSGQQLNGMHWVFAAGSALPEHAHPQEQLGYIIRGGFKVRIGTEETVLKAGDWYFVPGNTPHAFTSLEGCETEAIDIFSPPRELNY